MRMDTNKNRIKVAIVGIALCQAMQLTLSPVLPQIAAAFPRVRTSLIQMLITAPMILGALIAILSGWLVTRLSKKKLLMIGILIIGIGGLLPLAKDTFSLLFGARLFVGIGLGLLTTLSTAVVSDHFSGRQQAGVLGIQSAGVGGSMLLVTTVAGLVGREGYTNTYWINSVAFAVLIMVVFFLPDMGPVRPKKDEKIRLNRRVYGLALLTVIEFIFVISFSTNIAMHLAGSYRGDSSVAGLLIGAFSGVQVVVGLLTGWITGYTKNNSLYVAMVLFALGALFLIFYPGTLVGLFTGAILCGASQGLYVPRVMFEASNAVEQKATAMAVGLIVVAISLGQVLSPLILNAISSLAWGETSTQAVYTIGAITLLLVPMLMMILRYIKQKKALYQ